MNTYSEAWFDTFLSAGESPSVAPEMAFFDACLPLPDYRRVLDIACGMGRHSRALAERGYEVVGVDISEAALSSARVGSPTGASFVALDMRELDALEGEFDAAVCLWQSFGAFAEAENTGVLRSMARRVRPGGRLLLDIYNRDALGALPAEEIAVRAGREVRTRRSLSGDRFRVRISYEGTTGSDEFDWQVFTPNGFVEFAEAAGLEHVSTCAWFDPDTPAGPEHLRMQVLLAPGVERVVVHSLSRH